MQFNQYSIYTVVSETEKTKGEALKNVLKQLEYLNGLETDKQAKEFLKETWNISKSVNNFSIEDGLTISTLETYNFFNVVLKYENVCESINFSRDTARRSA